MATYYRGTSYITASAAERHFLWPQMTSQLHVRTKYMYNSTMDASKVWATWSDIDSDASELHSSEEGSSSSSDDETQDSGWKEVTGL